MSELKRFDVDDLSQSHGRDWVLYWQAFCRWLRFERGVEFTFQEWARDSSVVTGQKMRERYPQYYLEFATLNRVAGVPVAALAEKVTIAKQQQKTEQWRVKDE